MTIRNSPSGKAYYQFPEENFPFLWVSPTGDDSNSGTSSDEPLETLDAALRYAQASTVVSEIFLAAGTYTTQIMQSVGVPQGVKITGSDTVDVSPLLTLTSTGAVYLDFSGMAPGWTPGRWSGYDVRFAQGPSAIAVNQKRTILWNDANRLYLANLPRTPGNVAPVAGDMFYVCEPLADIDVTSPFITCIIGGRSTQMRFGSSRAESEPRVTLENVRIVNSDSATTTVAFFF